MTAFATLLWAANLLCDVVGQLSFKASASSTGEAQGLERWLRLFRNGWLWLGLTAFVSEFLLWLAFLSVVPLSVAVLVGSADVVAVMIGGRVFFGEALTAKRIAAAALIVGGIVLVGWP